MLAAAVLSLVVAACGTAPRVRSGRRSAESHLYESQWVELLPASQTLGEPAALAGITDAHNRVRAAVATSPPLPPLRWDDGLAQRAQDYSEVLVRQGSMQHSRDRQGIIGENLYWISTTCPRADAAPAVWATESACYAQRPGQVGQCDSACLQRTRLPACGHYTQMVWRGSEAVGCGQSYRSGVGCFVVCQYGPAGNWTGEPAY